MVARKHYFNPNCKCVLKALIVYSVFIPKMNSRAENDICLSFKKKLFI